MCSRGGGENVEIGREPRNAAQQGKSVTSWRQLQQTLVVVVVEPQ